MQIKEMSERVLPRKRVGACPSKESEMTKHVAILYVGAFRKMATDKRCSAFQEVGFILLGTSFNQSQPVSTSLNQSQPVSTSF